MSMEGGPTPEQVREAYIIDELKNTTPEQLMIMMQAAPTEAAKKNAQDPEKVKEYMAWEQEWQSLIDALDGEEAEKQMLNTELKRSELYITAGLTALARETLEGARDIAYAMGNEDVYEEVEKRIDELE